MNIEELNTQLEYLKETKNLIKEQLIAKGQPVDDNTPFREYVDNMNDLVDTTDANAVTSDIATGKSGYVDGQKVDGNLRDIASGSASSFIGTNFTVEDKPQFNLLDFTLPFTVDLIHRQGSIERLNVTYDKIATPINLSSGQIKAGETILGIAGKSTVIDTEYSGSHIATADEIIQPYTVFLNGQQITGNMVDMRNMPASRLSSIVTHDHISYDSTNNNLVEHTYSTYTEQNVAVGPGVQFAIEIPGSSVASQIGLTANKIKSGETILGVQGSVVELNGDTETVTPTTSQQIITPTSPKNALTQVTVNAVTSAIDSNIKTENIKSGVTILGVSGKSSVVDTSDANALSNTILDGYSAYVNGQKVQGTIQRTSGVGEMEFIKKNYDGTMLTKQQQLDNITIQSGSRFVKIKTATLTSGLSIMYNWGLNDEKVFNIELDTLCLMEKAGLTQQNLKYGETVLGISGLYTASNNPATANDIILGKEAFVNGQKIIGTYAGSTMKEYASETAMNNDIANIAEGELVKVVASGVTTYYIKETISGTPTMTKLVKESETISPEEYTENVDIADDILGTD